MPQALERGCMNRIVQSHKCGDENLQSDHRVRTQKRGDIGSRHSAHSVAQFGTRGTSAPFRREPNYSGLNSDRNAPRRTQCFFFFFSRRFLPMRNLVTIGSGYTGNRATKLTAGRGAGPGVFVSLTKQPCGVEPRRPAFERGPADHHSPGRAQARCEVKSAIHLPVGPLTVSPLGVRARTFGTTSPIHWNCWKRWLTAKCA